MVTQLMTLALLGYVCGGQKMELSPDHVQGARGKERQRVFVSIASISQSSRRWHDSTTISLAIEIYSRAGVSRIFLVSRHNFMLARLY